MPKDEELERLQEEAEKRGISIVGKNRHQLRKELEERGIPTQKRQLRKGVITMSDKWRGFLAGVTIFINALAITIVLVPLGLPSDIVQWTVAGVLSLDLVVELVLFIRS